MSLTLIACKGESNLVLNIIVSLHSKVMAISDTQVSFGTMRIDASDLVKDTGGESSLMKHRSLVKIAWQKSTQVFLRVIMPNWPFKWKKTSYNGSRRVSLMHQWCSTTTGLGRHSDGASEAADKTLTPSWGPQRLLEKVKVSWRKCTCRGCKIGVVFPELPYLRASL